MKTLGRLLRLAHTYTRVFKYVWPFFNIMHEKAKTYKVDTRTMSFSCNVNI